MDQPAPNPCSAPDRPQLERGDVADDGPLPDWVNAWGLAAFGLGVLALLLASPYLLGVRLLTISLSVCGVVVLLLGLWSDRNNPRKGRISLALGGLLSGAVLFFAAFVPGIINSRWTRDFSVPTSDPNSLVVVRRDYPRDEGKSLSAEDWVDAVREAIRQDEVYVRVESVQVDRLADNGENKYVLVFLRLGNSGHERSVRFAGFSRDQHKPILTDNEGKQYPFLEQRPRKLAQGAGKVVFEASPLRERELPATGFLDQLLVFEGAPVKMEEMHLELPASAWGRTGVCRFRCPGLFKVERNKGKP
jgi:hypothetical protein